MSDDELMGRLRPVVRAAFEAGAGYERAGASGPEPALDDGTARGLPPGLCAAFRPHLARVFAAGRAKAREGQAREALADELLAEFRGDA